MLLIFLLFLTRSTDNGVFGESTALSNALNVGLSWDDIFSDFAKTSIDVRLMGEVGISGLSSSSFHIASIFACAAAKAVLDGAYMLFLPAEENPMPADAKPREDVGFPIDGPAAADAA